MLPLVCCLWLGSVFGLVFIPICLFGKRRHSDNEPNAVGNCAPKNEATTQTELHSNIPFDEIKTQTLVCSPKGAEEEIEDLADGKKVGLLSPRNNEDTGKYKDKAEDTAVSVHQAANHTIVDSPGNDKWFFNGEEEGGKVKRRGKAKRSDRIFFNNNENDDGKKF